MVITRAVLHGYQPLFMLSHIRHFEITPSTIYQLIIGTNGCGKSSIMRELTPMPASKDDYAKDGYKTIEFTHRGSSYILQSTFSKGPHHSFVCNNEELNKGGTATVQRELIEQHLGVDNDVMAVLLDAHKFTSMAPMKRRDWVIRLSGNDMDFAMRVFNRLKSRTRDMQGHIKMLNTRLANEIKQIPTDAQIDALDANCKQLRGELNELMQCREYNAPQRAEVEQRIQQLLVLMDRTAKQMVNQRVVQPDHVTYDSLESILIDIARQKEAVTFQREKIRVHTEEYHKVKDLIDNLMRLRASNTTELDDRIVELQQQRTQQLALCIKGQVAQPAEYRAAFMAIRPQLSEIFGSMPSDLEWDKGRREPYHRDQIDAYTRLMDQTNEEMIRLRHRLQHIKESTKINCPRCNYSWLDGVADNEVESIEIALSAKQFAYDKAKASLKDANDALETYMECLAYTRRLNQLVSSNKSLQPLWEDVIAAWQNGRTPMQVLPVLSAWESSLEAAIAVESIDRNIAEIESVKQRLVNEGTNTVRSHSERETDLETIITVETRSLTLSLAGLQSLEAFADSVKRLLNAQVDLDKQLAQFDQLRADLGLAIKNELIDQAISTAHSQLGRAEEALNKARTTTALIEDLERTKHEAALDFEAFQLLTDEMSPVDGLIADQVVGFLDCFTDKINEVLNQIWTYDFRVLPCANQQGELDYKFPMRINACERLVGDVAEGSTSQVDAVNLAFKLIVMLYLGLDDFPLYLDELAPSLDEQHRLNIVMFAKLFVEMGRCSQMWMISHYAVQSGAFQPAETCVVNASNIVSLPSTYNQHVQMG